MNSQIKACAAGTQLSIELPRGENVPARKIHIIRKGCCKDAALFLRDGHLIIMCFGGESPTFYAAPNDGEMQPFWLADLSGGGIVAFISEKRIGAMVSLRPTYLTGPEGKIYLDTVVCAAMLDSIAS